MVEIVFVTYNVILCDEVWQIAIKGIHHRQIKDTYNMNIALLLIL